MKGSIIKRKDGSYMGKAYNKYTKKYMYVYETNKRLCEKKLKELINKINLEKENLENELKNKDELNKSINESFDFYLDNKLNCSEDTKNDYRSIKKVHLQPILKLKVKDLNDNTIQKFYNDILKEKGKKCLLRVNKCFGAYVRWLYMKHIITSNYMDFIELPKREKVKHISCSEEYYIDVINLLKNTNYQLYMIALIAGGCGLRLGEILGLSFDLINLNESYLKVDQQVTFEKGKGYYLSKELKTEESRRKVPLLDNVKEELTKFLAYQLYTTKKNREFNSEFNKYNLIFFTDKGNLLPSNSVDRYWRKSRKENGINEKLRIHDLRRYFATFLMRNSVPDKISKKLLGHTQINMTEYYQNDDDELVLECISGIDFKIQK